MYRIIEDDTSGFFLFLHEVVMPDITRHLRENHSDQLPSDGNI